MSNQEISRRILEITKAGASPLDAMKTVCGTELVETMINTLYDALRTPTVENESLKARVKKRLLVISPGHVTTLWDVMVWRKTDTLFVVGGSISVYDTGFPIDEAVERFIRLLD